MCWRVNSKQSANRQTTTEIVIDMVVKVEDGKYFVDQSVRTTQQQTTETRPNRTAKTPTTNLKCPLQLDSTAHDAKSQSPRLPFREYCGNSKRITVESNCQHLRVVGNSNRIFVHLNVGRLEVLGNANRVRVLENGRSGRISYTGNGGRVYLCGDADGTPSSVTDVRYTGCNGSVRLISRVEMLRTLAADERSDEERRQRRRRMPSGDSKSMPTAADSNDDERGNVGRVIGKVPNGEAAQYNDYDSSTQYTPRPSSAKTFGTTHTMQSSSMNVRNLNVSLGNLLQNIDALTSTATAEATLAESTATFDVRRQSRSKSDLVLNAM